MIMTSMPARTHAVVVGAENVNKDMDGSSLVRTKTSSSDNDGDFTNSMGPALVQQSAVITSAGEALVAQVKGPRPRLRPAETEAAKKAAAQAEKNEEKDAKKKAAAEAEKEKAAAATLKNTE